MPNINDLGFPFTSQAADRQYSASEWRDYFSALVSNGVAPDIGGELEVHAQPTPNKTVYIDTGAIIIRGAMRILAETVSLSFADNISGNPRIDRVVARLNYTDRKVEFVVKQGAPAASPVPPALTRSATTHWELSLAQVSLANGYSTITASEITNERLDEDVCGYSKTLYMQEFDDENNLLKYDRAVITADAYDRPTVVHYTRPADDSLFLKVTYSTASALGQYQTVTEEYYAADGATKYKTITYTLTYLASGLVDTMTRVVS